VRIVADRERCIGSGQCVLTEPSVFDVSDEDGLVVLLSDQPEGDQEKGAREALRSCPARALSLAPEEPR
jgi:ferredoxin